ncbi:TIM barrel protein [Jatrophihabitans sp.]|jgi:inosose dehydratase|uniref:TIM barrel protein n=1 Tax=Jatrophihabitans sp. TaxID=1932789 RepID=UPI002EFA0684
MPALPVRDRIAGAPISWGVCEAPGWGHELAAGRVLAEMAALGLRATELGPTGYLGGTPSEVRGRLDEHGLRLVGGFLPVPLHIRGLELSEAEQAIAVLAAAGAEVVVLAARSLDGSYDRKVTLGEEDWPVLLANLGRLGKLIAEHGLRTTLHPHVGTAIETRASVLRLLESSDVELCLDTGHLLIGGMQPIELLDRFAGRVGHVHLKDVRTAVAGPVAAGRVSYLDAVRAGLYAPLGAGDLDIAAIVAALEAAGYQGWYVLEQDSALDGEPPAGLGPILDAGRSVDYLLASSST